MIDKNKPAEIVIYKTKSGVIEFRADIDKETIWATQAQMAAAFGVNSQAITKHLKNIYQEDELMRSATCSKMEQVRLEGYREVKRIVEMYNLDAIISVGYRINSKTGTMFRQWATKVLRRHIIDGYTINSKRLSSQAQKVQDLQEVIRLLSNVMVLDCVSDETKNIIRVISEYSRALDILDDYDHQRLAVPKGTRGQRYELTYADAIKIIEAMKRKFNDSALVGQEKDNSFKGSLGAVYQTFGGKDVYATVEAKAANLLYLVTKNHSFVDGNKRIAAALFLCFLQKNKLLLRKDGSKRIDNGALAALTLMVAASKPSEKETMVKVILNLLK